MNNTNQYLARIGAVAAVLGAVVFFVAGLFHPMDADPNDLPSAFAEYATSTHWIGVHLFQFLGIALEAIALGALAATFEPGRAAAWGRIGLAGAVISVAVYAVLQAVDGVANHAMVHRLAAATGDERALVYEAAFAVRQIEVGLTGFFSLLFGATLILYSIAIVLSSRYPTWLGWVGIFSGLGTAALGLEQATHAFSALAMNGFMVFGTVDLAWAIVVGVFMWRLAPKLPSGSDDHA